LPTLARLPACSPACSGLLAPLDTYLVILGPLALLLTSYTLFTVCDGTARPPVIQLKSIQYRSIGTPHQKLAFVRVSGRWACETVRDPMLRGLPCCLVRGRYSCGGRTALLLRHWNPSFPMRIYLSWFLTLQDLETFLN
jgi:hypothetical protein